MCRWVYTCLIKHEIRHFTLTGQFLARRLVTVYVPDHTDHRINWMVTQFVFLVLACAIVLETSTEMALKTDNVVVEMESTVQNFAVKPQ